MFNPNSFRTLTHLPNVGMFDKISEYQQYNKVTSQCKAIKRSQVKMGQALKYSCSALQEVQSTFASRFSEIIATQRKAISALIARLYQKVLLVMHERGIEQTHGSTSQENRQVSLKPFISNRLVQILGTQTSKNSPDGKSVSQLNFFDCNHSDSINILKKVIEPVMKKEQPIAMVPTVIRTKLQKTELKVLKMNEKIKEKQIKADVEIIEPEKKKIDRLNRFKGEEKPKQKKQQYQDFDFQQMTDNWKIVGTSEQLEKKYLRITSMPDPTTVRPEKVLRKVLVFLLDKYKNGVEYEYIIEQFRSLRQDLTIQHIKNSFTAQVYEENSKISLFSDDIGQFNQCQSVLWDLYKHNIYRDNNIKNKFIGYQLLGLLIEQKYQQLQYTLTLLSVDELQSVQIQDILKLRRILLIGNYTEFFKFYSSRDALCRCLLNQYIDKVRAMCVAMISKTFGEKIKLSLLVEMLGDDQQILEQLILQIGGVITNGDFMLKQSYEQIKNSEYLFKRKKNVYLV